MIQERDLVKTARELRVEAEKDPSDNREALRHHIEKRMVNAVWVLRRLPDREKGFLHMRGSLWPDTLPDAGTYPKASMTSFDARRRVRISAQEIDQMQPALDLLLLLPDVADRQIVFWGAWHQDGEQQPRLPWAKVRRSMGCSFSRWTLKRRYEAALLWLAALVALQ